MCYVVYMMKPQSIPVRTLRNEIASILKRVEAGETIEVTRHGHSVARIVPAGRHRRWKTTAEFVAASRGAKPDPEFLELVRDLRSADQIDPFERWERS